MKADRKRGERSEGDKKKRKMREKRKRTEG